MEFLGERRFLQIKFAKPPKQCTFAAHQLARMAELVDALVSNTNNFTVVPVRPRLRVLSSFRAAFFISLRNQPMLKCIANQSGHIPKFELIEYIFTMRFYRAHADKEAIGNFLTGEPLAQ